MNQMYRGINYNYLTKTPIEKFSLAVVDERLDPDSCCKELYDDFLYYFFNNEKRNTDIGIEKIENRPHGNPIYYTLFINTQQFLLSSDYLGPSVFWSKEVGIVDSEIVEYLKIARTIGGHIIYPRGFQEGYYYNYKKFQYTYGINSNYNKNKYLTINTAKGGSSGFYDRADWTFELIKTYYSIIETKQSKENFIDKCKEFLPEEVQEYIQFIKKFETMYYALENSKTWLQQFKNFKSFCDFFSLVGSFVDTDYNINKFAPLFPILPTNFSDYIKNNIESIKARNVILKICAI